MGGEMTVAVAESLAILGCNRSIRLPLLGAMAEWSAESSPSACLAGRLPRG
jgi:hypothetical protein